MKILFFTNYFSPEVGGGPHILSETAETLAQSGHEVTVVTGFPRYNLPRLPREYAWRLLANETIGGMKVVRINAPNFYGNSWLSRGLVQILAPPTLALRALFVRRPDVVYTASPPLALGSAARLVARRFNVPWVVTVQDLFPQTMIDLGILRNRAFISYFQNRERSLYRNASALTVMSEANRAYVIARGAAPEKVVTIPNGVDTDLIAPAERMNWFRQANGLGHHFVVLFAGVMGRSQGLSTVIEAARLLAGELDVRFLLVGDGLERAALERQSAGLPNVRFLPLQPKDVYPSLLAAADVCLASLHPEVATPAIPSKIATIMAAGRPIVASLPLKSPAAHLITEARCGLVAPAGDAPALAQAVLRLKQDADAAKRLGNSGRQYAKAHLSHRVCVARLEETLTRVLKGGLRDARAA